MRFNVSNGRAAGSSFDRLRVRTGATCRLRNALWKLQVWSSQRRQGPAGSGLLRCRWQRSRLPQDSRRVSWVQENARRQL